MWELGGSPCTSVCIQHREHRSGSALPGPGNTAMPATPWGDVLGAGGIPQNAGVTLVSAGSVLSGVGAIGSVSNLKGSWDHRHSEARAGGGAGGSAGWRGGEGRCCLEEGHRTGDGAGEGWEAAWQMWEPHCSQTSIPKMRAARSARGRGASLAQLAQLAQPSGRPASPGALQAPPS